MSAPSKPWESVNHRPVASGYLDDLAYPQRPAGFGVPGAAPPPLPPRRQVQSSYGSVGGFYGGYNGFGGGYAAPFGANSLFSSSPYGMPYSPYRTPYDSRYGYGGGDDALSPFQSVESVVRAISSLSMMMESTYQSMFMSFRAVMGVAENMERLRRVVLDLFGGIAVVKSIVWFFRKILYVMGLRRLGVPAKASRLRSSRSGATSSPAETSSSEFVRLRGRFLRRFQRRLRRRLRGSFRSEQFVQFVALRDAVLAVSNVLRFLDVPTTAHSQTTAEEEVENADSLRQSPTFLEPLKRKKVYNAPADVSVEALRCMKKLTAAVAKRDSFTIFADFVSDSLRTANRPQHEVILAKQHIIQIIFNLQNGVYADSSQSLHPSCSTASNSDVLNTAAPSPSGSDSDTDSLSSCVQSYMPI